MSENITTRCPKCGGEISPESPQGLCPKCLLAQASLPTEPRPGKAAPPAIDELAVGFPQLEIIGLIGQGGMGFVFKARQPKLDRFVALKILPQTLASEANFAQRFAREGRLLARLNHPNIVTVHDFGQAGGFFYLLMEFVDGVSLRQALRAGRFTPAQAIGIVPGVCEALQYAHNEGILHRDIKPENILLDSKGRVKIADFGIAKLAGEAHEGGLTASGASLGTPHYMAPEQIDHPENVDQRADIYSLGVVFYEMLTGELPIGRFAAPSKKSAIDPRLDDVVLRSLENERQRRQASADEVKTQVEQIAQHPGPPDKQSASSKDWKSWSLSDIRILREVGGSIGRVFAAVVAGMIAIVFVLLLYGIVLRYRAQSQIVAPETIRLAVNIPTASSSMPQDLRDAKVDLAVITNTYGPNSTEVTTRKARIAELEYLTHEESNIPQDLRDAKGELAAATNTLAPDNPNRQALESRVKELEYLTRTEPDIPQDLRDAKAELAMATNRLGPANPDREAIESRVAELEYLTRTEPNIPQDLRGAKVKMIELKRKYGPEHPEMKAAEARVAILEQLAREQPDAPQDLRTAMADLAALREKYGPYSAQIKTAEARAAALESLSNPQRPKGATNHP